MPQKKTILQLPAADLPLAGDELIEVVQMGVNKKATTGDMGTSTPTPVGAENGLRKVGDNIRVGGTIIEATSTDLDGNPIQYTGAGGVPTFFTIDPTTDIVEFSTAGDTTLTLNGVAKTAIVRINGVSYSLARLPDYKSFIALISQSGASAPTITASKNGLAGTPVFSYFSAGEYLLTLAGAFPAGKTFVFCTNGVATVIGGYRVNNNTIAIRSGGDGFITNASIWIIVYD